ncbi:hypothetical protein DFJ63DRAFT_312270 [Scheffersomyces coipomensis]|uniref:uncharacterized protein n=1 Tax=Scheffersomyces coipomensis TaxID=1788519 RepID=UPI00315CEF63
MSGGENVNNPDARAAGVVASNDLKSVSNDEEGLLFFNHHEYLIDKYEPLTSSSGGPSLVINHFPNIHAAINSSTFASTRIVRIPRVYHTIESSDSVPQFSSYIPGREPASITLDTENEYIPFGRFDDNMFGQTSLTPLVPDLIGEDEYIEIITTINSYLLEAFNPYNLYNIIDSIFDFLTGGLLSMTMESLRWRSYSKRKLADLDKYIDQEINQKLFKNKDGLQLISPRSSGYLSVSIQFNVI